MACVGSGELYQQAAKVLRNVPGCLYSKVLVKR
jgi:hypothetical protein